MPVRRGMEDIKDYNKKKSAASSSGFIPEVFSKLKDDGEFAVVRIITDSPVDVDMHYVYDDGLQRSFLVYCPGRDECDYCHENNWAKAYFAFWVYAKYFVHAEQDNDGLWKPVEVGGRTMYQEEANKVMLMRKTHGKDNMLWNSFEDIYSDNGGTFTKGDIRVKRRGAKKTKETSYTVVNLGESPMPKEAAVLIGKLPDLIATMKGEVKNLDHVNKVASSPVDPKREELKAKMAESKKEASAPTPTLKAKSVDDDDLFDEKKTPAPVKKMGAVSKVNVTEDDELEEITYDEDDE